MILVIGGLNGFVASNTTRALVERASTAWYAALQIARELGPRHRIVTVIVDSGLRYLNGDLFR